jgi:hypothetical protein
VNIYRLLAPAALAFSLAGCAGSASDPVAVQALTAERQANLHITDVNAVAATGVVMTSYDLDRIAQKVKAQLTAGAPGVLTGNGPGLKMKVFITQYDKGNAFARAMLLGLGQIHIEATVSLVDSTDAMVAQYQVSKDFAFGGVYGASTNIEDVEDGFAKSVVEIVQQKRG